MGISIDKERNAYENMSFEKYSRINAELSPQYWGCSE